jgi:hypothetical protein
LRLGTLQFNITTITTIASITNIASITDEQTWWSRTCVPMFVC